MAQKREKNRSNNVIISSDSLSRLVIHIVHAVTHVGANSGTNLFIRIGYVLIFRLDFIPNQTQTTCK